MLEVDRDPPPEVAMATHAHHHPPHLPLRFFTVEHPYAGNWFLVAAGTLAALLLWLSNR